MRISTILDSILNPRKILKHLWRKTRLGSFTLREQFDAFPKPQYAWGMSQAVMLAKVLGKSRISAIEFGVAEGNGLLAMEQLAAEIKTEFGVCVDCYGFDSACGLPRPIDFRDVPYLWREGEFSPSSADMHGYESLQSKCSYSKLIIGDVKHTVVDFLGRDIAPIGFISFDLDLYSSTKDAFQIFEGMDIKYLPRIPVYFDDVSGAEGFINEFVGELLAINEFNAAHTDQKIAKIHGFEQHRKIPSSWNLGAYC